MDREFTQQRLAAAKALLLVYDTALTAITTGGAQSYLIDTGQTKTTVTKLDLKTMNDTISSLENKIAVYTTRLTGCGVVQARPAW